MRREWCYGGWHGGVVACQVKHPKACVGAVTPAENDMTVVGNGDHGFGEICFKTMVAELAD